jgi:hypothetical protein
MVGLKEVPNFQAKMTFSMARLAMIEMCRVFHLPPIRKTTDRVGAHGFAKLDEEIATAGLSWINKDGAEQMLQEFRETYEPFLGALANYLMIDLPPVVPQGEALDNWQRSTRGRTAKSLVEHAPSPD